MFKWKMLLCYWQGNHKITSSGIFKKDTVHPWSSKGCKTVMQQSLRSKEKNEYSCLKKDPSTWHQASAIFLDLQLGMTGSFGDPWAKTMHSIVFECLYQGWFAGFQFENIAALLTFVMSSRSTYTWFHKISS